MRQKRDRPSRGPLRNRSHLVATGLSAALMLGAWGCPAPSKQRPKGSENAQGGLVTTDANVRGAQENTQKTAVGIDQRTINTAQPAAPDGETGQGGEPLPAEERERDPGSETVTIRVVVDPPKRARVFWGPKDLGMSPLEIRRPRGSGPVDLILRAPGYLTVHTRAFTDRDDRVTVHLIPETEAPRMLGYRAKK